MAGSASARVDLDGIPGTHHALQVLVMSMAEVVASAGKRTFFGKDKEAAAVAKFEAEMSNVIRAMSNEGLIETRESSESVRATLMSLIELFALAYPNWKDAFGFAVFALVHRRDEAVANIEAIRRNHAEADYAFDHPLPNRGPRP